MPMRLRRPAVSSHRPPHSSQPLTPSSVPKNQQPSRFERARAPKPGIYLLLSASWIAGVSPVPILGQVTTIGPLQAQIVLGKLFDECADISSTFASLVAQWSRPSTVDLDAWTPGLLLLPNLRSDAFIAAPTPVAVKGRVDPPNVSRPVAAFFGYVIDLSDIGHFPHPPKQRATDAANPPPTHSISACEVLIHELAEISSLLIDGVDAEPHLAGVSLENRLRVELGLQGRRVGDFRERHTAGRGFRLIVVYDNCYRSIIESSDDGRDVEAVTHERVSPFDPRIAKSAGGECSLS